MSPAEEKARLVLASGWHCPNREPGACGDGQVNPGMTQARDNAKPAANYEDAHLRTVHRLVRLVTVPSPNHADGHLHAKPFIQQGSLEHYLSCGSAAVERCGNAIC